VLQYKVENEKNFLTALDL